MQGPAVALGLGRLRPTASSAQLPGARWPSARRAWPLGPSTSTAATSLQLDCSPTTEQQHEELLVMGPAGRLAAERRVSLHSSSSLQAGVLHGSMQPSAVSASSSSRSHFVLEPPPLPVGTGTVALPQAPLNGSTPLHNGHTHQQQPPHRLPEGGPDNLAGSSLQGSLHYTVHGRVSLPHMQRPSLLPSSVLALARQRLVLTQQPEVKLLPRRSAAAKARRKRRRRQAGLLPRVHAGVPAITVSKTSDVSVLQQYLQVQQLLHEQEQQAQQQRRQQRMGQAAGQHAVDGGASQAAMQPALQTAVRTDAGDIPGHSSPQPITTAHTSHVSAPVASTAAAAAAPPPPPQAAADMLQQAASSVRTTWLYLDTGSQVLAQARGRLQLYAHFSQDGKQWRAAPFVPVQTAAGARLWAAALPPVPAQVPVRRRRHPSSSQVQAPAPGALDAPGRAMQQQQQQQDVHPGLGSWSREGGHSVDIDKQAAQQEGGRSRHRAEVCSGSTGMLHVAVSTAPGRPAGPLTAPDRAVLVSPGGSYLLDAELACHDGAGQMQQQQQQHHVRVSSHQQRHHHQCQQGRQWQTAQGRQARGLARHQHVNQSHPAPPADTYNGIAGIRASSSSSRKAAVKQHHNRDTTTSGSSSTSASSASSSNSLLHVVRAVPLLNQACLLVADAAMVAGRTHAPQDDQLCVQFSSMWRASQQVHPSLLVYTTHRSWTWFEHLWRNKQAVLQPPDVLVLSGGTRIMYHVAGGAWQEDLAWRARIERLWDRQQVVAAVTRVAHSMQHSQHLPPASEVAAPMAAPGAMHLVQHASAAAAAGSGRLVARDRLLPCDASAGLCTGASLLQHQHSQHQPQLQPRGQGVHAPSALVRADVHTEQNAHLVRVLVHRSVLQQFLDALEQVMHGQQAPLSHVMPAATPEAAGTAVAASAGVPSGHVAATQAGQHVAPHSAALHEGAAAAAAPPARRHQHTMQQHVSSTSSSSTASKHAAAVGAVEPHLSGVLASQGQQQQPWQQHRPQQGLRLAWQVVVQPGEASAVVNRNWCVVDVLPVDAGTDNALAHVTARFRIQPHARQLPMVRASLGQPWQHSSPGATGALCTHAVVFRARAGGAQAPAATPWPGCTPPCTGRSTRGARQQQQQQQQPATPAAGTLGVQPATSVPHAAHMTTTSHWGAAGVMYGLQQLGLAGAVHRLGRSGTSPHST